MKILVAIDGSAYTKRMLAYIAAHYEWLGAQHQYTVVHVVPAVPARAAGALDKELLKSYYDEEAERVFKPVRTFLSKQGVKAEFVAKTGPAVDAVAALATKGRFELLIMGSRGHGNFVNLVLGSVATRVMAQCETPVLLIR